MTPTRRALVLLAMLLAPVLISLVLPAVPASAQTTGTTTVAVSVSAVPTGITHSKPRSGPNLLINQINHADCENDDSISVPVTTINASAYTLQAWIGISTADCSALTARSGTQIACWLVASVIPAANTTSTLVNIPVRAIVAGYTEDIGLPNGGGVVSSGGTSSTDADAGISGGGTSSGTGGTDSTGTNTGFVTGFSAPIMPGPEACNQTATNIVSYTTATIGFYLIDATTGLSVASTTVAMNFKLVGPQPPTNVTAGVGGNLLVTNFTSNLAGDMTINGYNVYCDPAPGDAAAIDAGLLASDAGSGTYGDCTNAGGTNFEPGNLPPPGAAVCGTAQRTSQTVNASGLVDGVPYHVAVAAIDTFYNEGPLSEVACGVPQPINGFYKEYRAAGGKGGGGFCSFSMRKEPVAGFALLALACGSMIRRRRKK